MGGRNLNQRVCDISVTICFQCIISQLIAPRPVEKGPSQSYPPRDRTLESEEAAGRVTTSATRQIKNLILLIKKFFEIFLSRKMLYNFLRDLSTIYKDMYIDG